VNQKYDFVMTHFVLLTGYSQPPKMVWQGVELRFGAAILGKWRGTGKEKQNAHMICVMFRVSFTPGAACLRHAVNPSMGARGCHPWHPTVAGRPLPAQRWQALAWLRGQNLQRHKALRNRLADRVGPTVGCQGWQPRAYRDVFTACRHGPAGQPVPCRASIRHIANRLGRCQLAVR